MSEKNEEGLIVVKIPTKKKVTKKKTVRKKRVKKYLNNADLLVQLAISNKNDRMTDELAKMLNVLVDRYASKGRFAVTESFKEDMKSHARLTIVKGWRKFDASKQAIPNPFAYFTTVVTHAFYQYMNEERKQRDIKAEKLLEVEKSPSYAYMANYEYEQKMEHDTYEGTNVDEEIITTIVNED